MAEREMEKYEGGEEKVWIFLTHGTCFQAINAEEIMAHRSYILRVKKKQKFYDNERCILLIGIFHDYSLRRSFYQTVFVCKIVGRFDK